MGVGRFDLTTCKHPIKKYIFHLDIKLVMVVLATMQTLYLYSLQLCYEFAETGGEPPVYRAHSTFVCCLTKTKKSPFHARRLQGAVPGLPVNWTIHIQYNFSKVSWWRHHPGYMHICINYFVSLILYWALCSIVFGNFYPDGV